MSFDCSALQWMHVLKHVLDAQTCKCFFQTLAVIMLCFSCRAYISSTCLMQCLLQSRNLYLHCANPISLHYTYTKLFTVVHFHFYWIHILRLDIRMRRWGLAQRHAETAVIQYPAGAQPSSYLDQPACYELSHRHLNGFCGSAFSLCFAVSAALPHPSSIRPARGQRD